MDIEMGSKMDGAMVLMLVLEKHGGRKLEAIPS
jgi:hypothetical protein